VSITIECAVCDTRFVPEPKEPYYNLPASVELKEIQRGGWTKISVSAQIVAWPSRCANCMAVAETKLDVYGNNGEDIKWCEVPYCHTCLEQLQPPSIRQLHGCMIAALIVIWPAGLVYLILRLCGAIEPRESSPNDVPAVRYLGWYGSVHTLKFRNHNYADLFRMANHDKLVNE
jgi:hypothetical protein